MDSKEKGEITLNLKGSAESDANRFEKKKKKKKLYLQNESCCRLNRVSILGVFWRRALCVFFLSPLDTVHFCRCFIYTRSVWQPSAQTDKSSRSIHFSGAVHSAVLQPPVCAAALPLRAETNRQVVSSTVTRHNNPGDRRLPATT